MVEEGAPLSHSVACRESQAGCTVQKAETFGERKSVDNGEGRGQHELWNSNSLSAALGSGPEQNVLLPCLIKGTGQ